MRQLFPDSESYTHLYAEHGLLTPKTVLAHCCHLSPAEVELVKANRCAVSHCPVSNSYLGSGICPVRELLDEGITVGLGTDVSGGLSPSILVAAREAGCVSRYRTCFMDDDKIAQIPKASEDVDEVRAGEAVEADAKQAKEGTGADEEIARQLGRDRLKLSIDETLYLATRGGAKALGLEKKVGGFEVGMEFDAQFVDLGKRVRYGNDNSRANQGAEHSMETGNDGLSEEEHLDQTIEHLSRLGTVSVEGGRGGVQIWEGMDWDETLAKWVNCGDERNTRAVWVKGRLVSGGMGS